MFRIDFGWYMVENVEGHFLSMLLRAWARTCIRSLDLCIRSSILAYTALFLRLYICEFWPTYAGSRLRMLVLTCVCETLSKGLTLPIFTSFSIVSLLYAILTPFFAIFAPKHHYILLLVFILAPKTSFFIIFTWIKNLCYLLLLQSLSPYTSKGSTNKVVEWYNLLVPKTRAYIQEASFEPILSLLLEKSANATLVQCLIKRWWDTTHTFHIVEWEMMVPPYDFDRMTNLSFKGAIINLDGMSGIQLGLDMLGRKYPTETIRYFDLMSNYMLLQQRTMEEHIQMARAFLLHLLGAYLFTNGGKMVSLRWLTLFKDFADARKANQG